MLLYGGERENLGIAEAEAQRRATYSHFRYRPPRYDLNARDILAMAARRATEAARRQKAEEARQEAIARNAVLEPPQPRERYPNGPRVTDVMRAITEATGYNRATLEGPWRPIPLARARQLGYWLLLMHRSDLSLAAIGRAFGRHHTTIIHGLRVFERYRNKPPLSDWLQHPSIQDLK